MYPILILREELVCALILIFLLFISRKFQIGKDSSTFYRLVGFALAHVLLDAVTVWTVNHLELVPLWINDALHVLFYMTAIFFSNEIFFYVLKQCYPNIPKKIYWFALILAGVYLACLPFLNIEYAHIQGTNSSTGPAAYVGFSVGYIYFIAAIVLIFLNFKKLSNAVKSALFPMLVVLIATETAQILWRELLFTGGAITVVTVSFFFSLENPVQRFERRMMKDALTGVGSRHSYQQDMVEFEKAYAKEPDDRYLFLYCDLDDLRGINNRYGHLEGDRYISIIADILNQNLASANSIYRIGGDEFVVIYIMTDEKVVREEMSHVNAECATVSSTLPYKVSVSMGYAVSGFGYDTLKDVVRTADFIMYRNKTDHHANSSDRSITGTKLNLTGLTDKVFDAMCTSNVRNYPFITNMETGITRISPFWVQYFGLTAEFQENFESTWLDFIHPDDKEVYSDALDRVTHHDVERVTCRYRAMATDGNYVTCSSSFSFNPGKEGMPDTIVGYLVNHGVEDTIDSLTGLPNFAVLTDVMRHALQEHAHLVVIKLGIKGFARINMLYSYATGDIVLKTIADTLKRMLEGKGAVYCQSSKNFSLYLPGYDHAKAQELYDIIVDRFAHGVLADGVAIPMTIAGGAFEIGEDTDTDIKTLRAGLLSSMEESMYNDHGKLVFYTPPTKTNGNPEGELLTVIHRDALTKKEFFLLRYQPIVDTQTHKIVGAEALLRWNAPKYGEVSPGRFIGFLESDSCYFDLGMFILRRAIMDAKAIREKLPTFVISVNITAQQLLQKRFISDVKSLLRQIRYPAEGLMLELTERCKELESKVLAQNIRELRDSGIKVAFDDMGTGYSTVDLLLNIPVDEMKLDYEFVSHLMENSSYQVLVDALVQGREHRGYTICFEGVETEATAEFLKQYGSSLSAGYYYARPLLLEDFMAKIGKTILP